MQPNFCVSSAMLIDILYFNGIDKIEGNISNKLGPMLVVGHKRMSVNSLDACNVIKGLLSLSSLIFSILVDSKFLLLKPMSSI